MGADAFWPDRSRSRQLAGRWLPRAGEWLNRFWSAGSSSLGSQCHHRSLISSLISRRVCLVATLVDRAHRVAAEVASPPMLERDVFMMEAPAAVELVFGNRRLCAIFCRASALLRWWLPCTCADLILLSSGTDAKHAFHCCRAILARRSAAEKWLR